MTIGALRAASLKPLVIHVRYRQLLNSMKILGYASHHALDYFWSIMPSHIVAQAVDTFQDAIELALDEILSPPAFDVPDCHWKRYRRAHSISQLPARYGGCNLANQQCLAPAAYVATTCAVLRDP